MIASYSLHTNPRFRLPILHGLSAFDQTRIGPDIIAGVTLAALGIPEVMGYTKIIGTPVTTAFTHYSCRRSPRDLFCREHLVSPRLFGFRLVDAIGLHGEVRPDSYVLGGDLDQPLTSRDEHVASILWRQPRRSEISRLWSDR